MTMNAKLKRYIEVHKRSGSLDNVQLSPAEISDISAEADGIFEQMDKDKVSFLELTHILRTNSLPRRSSCKLWNSMQNSNTGLRDF